ncbi:MAG TPA: M56 family metallopeptidase [Puia sp.]|nr:M56 family metallopeptidase [Puia sp.]
MALLTHSPILTALGRALFGSLWQMAALWLAYTLLLAVFRRTAAAIRHGLALFLLAGGSAWTAVTFFLAWLSPGSGPAFWLPFLPSASAPAGGFWQAGRNLFDEVLPYASTLYLTILGLLMIRYGNDYRRSRNLTRLGLSSMPPQFRTFVAATALQLGIRKPVKAWLSSLIDVPLTMGFLKPVILLPVTMITQLNPAQVEAILVHELAHIQRKDYLLHIIVMTLGGLFFFNPFARLLVSQLKKERENCCDDMVLQFKYDAHAYVSALLTLATRRQRTGHLALAATGTGDRLLLQRAKRVLLREKGERSRPGIRPMLTLLFTLVLTGLALYHPLLKTRTPARLPVARTNTTYFITPRLARTSTVSGMRPDSERSQLPAAALALAASSRELSQLALPLADGPRKMSGLGSADRPAPEILSDRPAVVRVSPSRSHRAPGPQHLDLAPDGGDVLFINTADDAVGLANAATEISTAIGDPGGSTPSPDNRDFSLNMPLALAGPAGSDQLGSPFVPNAIWSFQYNGSDSTNREEQLLYQQQTAQYDVLAAIAQLQQQTASQILALDRLRTKAAMSVRLRQQIDSRKLQLQQDYNRKIDSWQKRLQKTVHIKVIVYI